jgi:competence protein ComEC
MRVPAAPAVRPATAFAAGVAIRFLLALPTRPALALLLGLLGLALRRPAGTVTAAAAAGLLVATLGAPPTGELKSARVADATGTVSGPWTPRPGGWSSPLEVDRLSQGSRSFAGRTAPTLRLDVDAGVELPQVGARVSARGLIGRSSGYADTPALPPGPWRLRVKSRRFLAVQGEPGWLSRMAEGWRCRVRAPFLAPSRAGRPGMALGRAFVLGDGHALPLAWRWALRRNGLSHLIAVSGFNVSLVAALAAAAGCYLPRAGRLLLCAAAVLLYTVAVGPQPSVVRATTMALLALSGLALGRVPLARQGLALALVAALAWHPAVICDPGFQLSFAATAGLLWLAPRWAERWASRWPRPLALGLAATLAAQVASLPWSVAAFGTLSPAAPLWNLLAAPWAALSLAAALAWALLAALVPAGIADLAALLLDPLTLPLAGLAALPPSPLLSVPWPGGWFGGLAASLGVAAWVEGGRARRAAQLVALSALGGGHGSRPEPGFEALFLDVGQGAAVLLTHGAEAILVDGGGAAGFDLGGRVLLPVLVRRGVWRIRLAIVSHADADHCLGLLDLAAHVPIDEVWAPAGALGEPCVEALGRASGAGVEGRVAGERLLRAGFALEVLHPAAGASERGDNRTSLVLRASAAGRRLLLPGDIDAAVEQELVAGDRAGLAADLLEVPHHGSSGSSSAPFLAAVKPRLAVISAGTTNSYGHPGHATLERLLGSGARVLRTDRDGLVEVAWRAREPWHLRLPASPPAGREPR